MTAGNDNDCNSGLTVTPDSLIITEAYVNIAKLPPVSNVDISINASHTARLHALSATTKVTLFNIFYL